MCDNQDSQTNNLANDFNFAVPNVPLDNLKRPIRGRHNKSALKSTCNAADKLNRVSHSNPYSRRIPKDRPSILNENENNEEDDENDEEDIEDNEDNLSNDNQNLDSINNTQLNNLNQLNSTDKQLETQQTLNSLIRGSDNPTSQQRSQMVRKERSRTKTPNPMIPTKYRKVTACQNVSLNATPALSNLGDDDIAYLFAKDDTKLDEEFEFCETEVDKLNDMLDDLNDGNCVENDDSIVDYTEEIAEIGLPFDPKSISESILKHNDNN